MKKIILLFVLAFICCPAFVSAQFDVAKTIDKMNIKDECPKYVIYKKKIVTSSTRGEVSNTGWIFFKVIEICGEIPKEPIRIGNDIRYIKQNGNNEEGIITEEYVKYEDPFGKCEASNETDEYKMTFPALIDFTKKAEDVAEKIPRVRKFGLVFNPIVTVKRGEECCEVNKIKKPVTYTEVKAGIEAKFDLQIYLQGGKISFSQTFWAMKVEGSLELALFINPFSKGKIEVVGKTYDLAGASGTLFNNTSKCAGCTYIGYTGEGGVKLAAIAEGKFGIYAWDFIDKEWMEKEEILVSAEGSGTLGAKINLTYAGDKCSKPKPGLHFSGRFGQLKVNFKFGLKFLGFNPEYSFEKVFFEGKDVDY